MSFEAVTIETNDEARQNYEAGRSDVYTTDASGLASTRSALPDPDAHMVRFAEMRQAPYCACGGYLKPATISFGQSLNPEDMQRATAAVRETDLVVALGTTLSVYPAAQLPLTAAPRGVAYVVVNRGATDHDGRVEVALRLEGDVAELFPPAVGGALGR